MSTIDSLNRQYVENKKKLDALCGCSHSVIMLQNKNALSGAEKVSQAISLLKGLFKETECGSYLLLQNAAKIGNQYSECQTAVSEYASALKSKSNEGVDALRMEIQKVQDKQAAFEDTKKLLENSHYSVDSTEAIVKIIKDGLENAISIEKAAVEDIKSEAKELLINVKTVDLRLSDPIDPVVSLPATLLLGQYPSGKDVPEILKAIGHNESRQEISVNLRNYGNVLVSSDFEHMSDESIDAFVIAYILRFIEAFPLGTVNVHIFDQNTNYLYKRLTNCFQSESAGESVKKTVQIHESYNDLSAFREVICEDIFKKTTVDKPDLYSIYENDSSDPFNLIVLRDGLVDGSGYASADILDTINALTKPGDIGHKCGLRFLIIDNSASFTKNLTATNKHLIGAIQGNCEVRLGYVDGKYSIDSKPVKVLSILDNLDKYVQERSRAVADAIGGMEKNYISLDDVSADTIEEIGNIMYIPVGMSGGVTVELPLSCKDEDGTVAGQCIGYMAIGQSGSGKSSFFHSIVLNGCMKYSPRDLQFWLLDFKNGGASSKYSRCGIPHIKMIAENNKIDDALCLFQMILEEMERRSKAFNKHFTDNIIEYNKKADAEGLEYFPRIVIAIDEVQEIFREDNASVIQKLISSISTRMRSAGMHFVMVAQNLSEGKSYMLKDAFLPSATGRICFRVAPDIPRDSGFDDTFIERRQEIAELKTGEAYVSYGKGTIKKVKMAFISPQDMSEKYFASICNRYPEYANIRPLVIGSKKRLAITDPQQGTNTNYSEIIGEITGTNGNCSAVIGEDAYRMRPQSISFSQNENSSVLFLGSDKRIASSLCASTVISLLRQNVEVHLFNGDRTRIQEGTESVQHPFMYLCQYASETPGTVQNHRLDQLKSVMCDMYAEYLNRQALVQQADFEDPIFEPVFIVINDLFGIESFISNDIIEGTTASDHGHKENSTGLMFEDLKFDYSVDDSDLLPEKKETGQFRESIQNIMSALLKNGYRYNMYVVLAIKGDPSTWRNAHIASEINNVVLFNDTEYADQIDNAYYLKEMLKNISNDGGEETMAVWSSKKTFSKIRPIIYKLSNEPEKNGIDRLIKGERV